ncbi:MAG: glycine betaine/L-proline ABC transporter ATP-binding protein ProV [Desulfobacteraceae bacterium]|nr:glycine betaine/L-proline ABC transporter ATP-binding protein ProV [Desulfobacteraceae bacterium]
MNQIVIKNLYKIFGSDPQKAISMLKDGHDKNAVLEKTGMTVGVNDASFEINEGEIFVVMGLSGSGKSTLVRLLNRLIEPSSGEVIINGRDITAMNRNDLIRFRLNHMSMVFQSFALMPQITVLENAAFGLELAKVELEKRKARAMEALAQVGLEGWEDQYPDQLSGGMQQRVGLARALAVEPDIMLMDEAFSALDPLIRTEMQDELLKLQDNSKRTIVFISHDLDEALRIGDRIAIMQGGRVVQVGTPEEILQNPADDYVRAFFRGVDPTNVISAGDIVKDSQPTIVKTKPGGLRSIHELLSSRDRKYAYVLDSQHRFLGVLSVETIQWAMDKNLTNHPIDICFIKDVKKVNSNDYMQDILSEVASRPWPIPVVDDNNVYLGVVSKNRFLKALHKNGN